MADRRFEELTISKLNLFQKLIKFGDEADNLGVHIKLTINFYYVVVLGFVKI